MKRIIAIIGFLLSVAIGFSQTYVTTTNLNLRDASSAQGHILTNIPSGTIVQSAGENNGWTKVTYKTVAGYISTKYLQVYKANTAKPQTQVNTNPPKSDVHYYTNVNGNTVQAPTQYDSAPEGATAQCRDGTYSFSQNHRGTCSHHGGVAKWLH